MTGRRKAEGCKHGDEWNQQIRPQKAEQDADFKASAKRGAHISY